MTEEQLASLKAYIAAAVTQGVAPIRDSTVALAQAEEKLDQVMLGDVGNVKVTPESSLSPSVSGGGDK